MSGRRLVGQEWGKFETLVVPRDASARQRDAMRKCFFAGAEALFRLLITRESAGGVLTDSSEPEPADLALMEDLEAELVEFLTEAATSDESRH